MRGKEPKIRDRYVIRLGDGTLVDVSREIYLEWYRSRNREKYQIRRDKKHKVCSLESICELHNFCPPDASNPEELAFQSIQRDTVREALRELTPDEAYLIYLLFYLELPVNEVARCLGCSRKTIQNRRERIFNKLQAMLLEIQSD